MDYKEVTKCRVCGSTKLSKYLSLGEVPLANNLTNDSRKYPVDVLFCEECSLSQLSIVVNPELLFSKYFYHSSVSKTFQEHCKQMAKDVKEILSKNVPSGHTSFLVCDIAANDGCLLEQFRDEEYYTIGVEPCKDLAEKCREKRISVVDEFWNEETAARVPASDVITATNVLAHVDDIKQFVRLAKERLREYTRGIMVVEVPYLPEILCGNEFDTIYHEHLSYFLLKPLVRLFSDEGVPIFKAEFQDIHGGSLRIYASPYNYPVENSVESILGYEMNNGFYSFNKYQSFAKNIQIIMDDLPFLLFSLQQEGRKVMGFGASAKGISLLNYCGVDNSMIHSIVDETPEKQGHETPGTRIPIVPFDAFNKESPDYILLLAWNFKEELIRKTIHLGAKYIIPIPEVITT